MKRDTKNMTNINLLIDKSVNDALDSLAERHGVTKAFVIRRSLAYTTVTGKIYWPVDKTIEEREHEKFGAATPVYDQETDEPVKGAKSGRKGPAIPAE